MTWDLKESLLYEADTARGKKRTERWQGESGGRDERTEGVARVVFREGKRVGSWVRGPGPY